MIEENNAAPAVDTATPEINSQIEGQVAKTASEESAPQNQEAPATETPEQKQDNVQKAINKQVARRGAAERRAEKLEAENKALREQQKSLPTAQPVMPNEADYSFDDPKYKEDVAQYHRDVATKTTLDVIAENNKTKAVETEQENRQKIESDFWVKADKANIEGFADSLATLPTFNPDTLDTIMMADNAPELANYLAQHLDVAYEIASVPVGVAGMKLGQIAASLANKPKNNISSAPDPINPISQGGAATGGETDPSLDGATFT